MGLAIGGACGPMTSIQSFSSCFPPLRQKFVLIGHPHMLFIHHTGPRAEAVILCTVCSVSLPAWFATGFTAYRFTAYLNID